MTFTKKKLAAAIGGTLLASVGIQQAQAAVDLDGTAGAATALLYASEAVIGTSGLGLTDAAAEMDIVGLMAVNGVAADTDIRITLTLSSGKFSGAPSVSVDNGAGGVACNGNACQAYSLFSGGTTADSTVTFNSTVTTGQAVDSGAHFNFAMAGLTVTAQSAITATVATAIADNFGSTDLPTNTGAYLSFGPLLSVAADATGAETTTKIDVAQNSLFFSGATKDANINVGGAIVKASTAPVGVTTNAIDATDIIASAQHTITAANGFSAFNQGTAAAVKGSITVNGAAATVSTADATLAAAAAAVVPANGNTAGSNAVVLTVPTANTVAITETTLTATVTGVTAGAVYSAANASGTVSLASLARNGSSARLTFSVNPDSSFPMSIRLTNDSAIAGPVTLTLTNDDGDTSTAVSITAITGGPAGDLAAGASTGLLSMANVYAAVQAADATFALGATSNKLRVAVSSLTPTIVLNAFSLSSDGTTFSMVTDAGA